MAGREIARPTMMSLCGVRLDRGGRTVLSDIDLTLSERRIGVIGANGSGKSSFARLLNGLLLPSRGSVALAGGCADRSSKSR